MGRNKNHPDGWLIFGFAFVAPALLPVMKKKVWSLWAPGLLPVI
jgi:hypothetical protein